MLASSPAAQAHHQIDAKLRLVDAKTSEPLSEQAFILRDGDGVLLVPQSQQDGEISFLVSGRKLIVEPVAKGFKPTAQSIMLENAPKVFVTIKIDALSGRVAEVVQKPVFPEVKPKIRRPGSGMLPLMVPPVNDNCASPSPIGLGVTAWSTVDATTDGPSNCLGQINRDIWYSFVAPGTGTLTVSTCNQSTLDTKLAIYTGLSCPPGAPIGCNDDSGGCASFTSIANAPVVSGNSYLIRLGAFGATSTGTGTVTLTFVGPPAFDECAGAVTVGCGSSTNFNNAAATTNATDPAFTCRIPSSGQGFGTSWFKFVAASTTVTVDTLGSSTGDTLLAVYSGTCGALTQIGCNDDAVGFLSIVNVVGLTIGQTYYIQVAGYGAGNVGNNTLNLTCGAPPGDACADAISVGCGGSETVNNSAFTTDPGDPAYSCRFGGPGQGIGAAWFTFVATHTSANVNTLGSTAFDTMIAVYSGTCGAFVELGCNDDAFGLLSDVCVDGLTIGQTYYIQASSFSIFDTGDIQVNVECPCPLPPENDECENAEALVIPSSTVLDNTLATDDIAVPCGVFSGPFKNVWYLVSGTGNTITATTCNGGTVVSDTKISVFCADCGDLVCVTGNDDDCDGGGPIFASTVSWCSQVGANYLITVGNFSPSTTPGTIQLDLSSGGGPCVADVVCLPQGACCLEDGSCVVTTVDDCAAQGGTYQGDDTECVSNAIADGGFEAGVFSGNWNESSTNFGTPLCDAGCGFGGGTGPNSGAFWAWFGGIPAFEEGAVSQLVNIPLGATTLDFFLEIPFSSGNGTDFLEVTVDGNQEYLVLESFGPFIGYVLQQVDVSAYADGGNHTIEFHSIISGSPDLSNFFVDDVSINVVATECTPPEDCFVLDFETDDAGLPMAHGARVNTEFDGGANFPVTITGTEDVTNANTLAILNSTTGPAAQDPDLLVGSGNILILQNSDNQSLCGPDTYCTHNDDEDGGQFRFVFNVPVTPSSIDLIDIDSTDVGDVVVTLFDTNADQRIYNVSPGWTGDFVTDATSGIGTLDLTNLGPQPGFIGIAVGTDIGNFDPTAVVEIRVTLPNSGAVDNLTWCQPGGGGG